MTSIRDAFNYIYIIQAHGLILGLLHSFLNTDGKANLSNLKYKIIVRVMLRISYYVKIMMPPSLLQ